MRNNPLTCLNYLLALFQWVQHCVHVTVKEQLSYGTCKYTMSHNNYIVHYYCILQIHFR